MSQLHVPQGRISQPASIRNYLALAAGLLVIGASGILVQVADAPGPVSGFYRMGIGWLVLSVFVVGRGRGPQMSPRAFGWAALAGLFFGLDLTFWTSGIMLSGPTKPTLLANTTPLWVGLGAMLLFRERHSPMFWAGLVVALSGAALVVGDDLLQSPELGLGSAFGLVSAFFYSAFFLAAQRGRAQTNALSFAWASALASALVLLAAAVILGQDLSGYSRQTIMAFVLMGVVIQVVGWLLITYAQGHLPASIISPTMLGQPVLTGLFSVLLFGERFSTWEVLGAVLVLGGVFLVHRSKRLRKDRHDPPR